MKLSCSLCKQLQANKVDPFIRMTCYSSRASKNNSVHENRNLIQTVCLNESQADELRDSRNSRSIESENQACPRFHHRWLSAMWIKYTLQRCKYTPVSKSTGIPQIQPDRYSTSVDVRQTA